MRVRLTNKRSPGRCGTIIRSGSPRGRNSIFGWTCPLSTPRSRNPEQPVISQGLGDMLVQAIYVRRLTDTQGFGFGAQLILPTARKDALGKGKWRLRPTAGYRWSVNLTPGSFFQLTARYDFSFAGKDNRKDVRELQFAPNLEIELPGEAYISIFPSTDIRYNFVKHRFFFPANLEIGKSWGRIVCSVEGAAALINRDEGPYRHKLEVRVGVRF